MDDEEIIREIAVEILGIWDTEWLLVAMERKRLRSIGEH